MGYGLMVAEARNKDRREKLKSNIKKAEKHLYEKSIVHSVEYAVSIRFGVVRILCHHGFEKEVKEVFEAFKVPVEEVIVCCSTCCDRT
jgi:hypothetical protein